MKARIFLAVVAALAGLMLAVLLPALPQKIRKSVGLEVQVSHDHKPTPASSGAHGHGDGHPHGDGEDDHDEEGKVELSAEQIAEAAISVAKVGNGVLVVRGEVPGVLAANADRLAKVTARASGTLVDIKKRLGDSIQPGEVVAIIESREIADAKGEYLAASRAANLAKLTLTREAKLWDQRVSAEQDFLQARAAAEEASIRLDLARQRLSALGLREGEIANLPAQPIDSLRRLELRASLTGQIIARSAVPGGAVGADTELFTIADMSKLWVEMTVAPRNLPSVRVGQTLQIKGDGDSQGEGKVGFLSPLLDPETRSARAVAEIDNKEGYWRPGAFVTVELALAEQPVEVLVPKTAIQELAGEKVVFVRTPEGFSRRDVTLGREDASNIEVLSGLEAGAEIATDNTFVLKAALGKSEAGHSH